MIIPSILRVTIHFYLKKISERNTSQGQNRGYSTDAFGSLLLKLCHWKINEKIMTVKLRRKVTTALPVQERFL